MISRNTVEGMGNPNGMTGHLNPRPLGIMKAGSSCAAVHLRFVTTGRYAFQGVLHVGKATKMILDTLLQLAVVHNKA